MKREMSREEVIYIFHRLRNEGALTEECREALQFAITALSRPQEKRHLPLTVQTKDEALADVKEHDSMTMQLLAEHLGVELWKAMEIARWESAKPRPLPSPEVIEKLLIDHCYYEEKTDKMVLDLKKIAQKICGELSCPPSHNRGVR